MPKLRTPTNDERKELLALNALETGQLDLYSFALMMAKSLHPNYTKKDVVVITDKNVNEISNYGFSTLYFTETENTLLQQLDRLSQRSPGVLCFDWDNILPKLIIDYSPLQQNNFVPGQYVIQPATIREKLSYLQQQGWLFATTINDDRWNVHSINAVLNHNDLKVNINANRATVQHFVIRSLIPEMEEILPLNVSVKLYLDAIKDLTDEEKNVYFSENKLPNSINELLMICAHKECRGVLRRFFHAILVYKECHLEPDGYDRYAAELLDKVDARLRKPGTMEKRMRANRPLLKVAAKVIAQHIAALPTNSLSMQRLSQDLEKLKLILIEADSLTLRDSSRESFEIIAEEIKALLLAMTGTDDLVLVQSQVQIYLSKLDSNNSDPLTSKLASALELAKNIGQQIACIVQATLLREMEAKKTVSPLLPVPNTLEIVASSLISTITPVIPLSLALPRPARQTPPLIFPLDRPLHDYITHQFAEDLDRVFISAILNLQNRDSFASCAELLEAIARLKLVLLREFQELNQSPLSLEKLQASYAVKVMNETIQLLDNLANCNSLAEELTAINNFKKTYLELPPSYHVLKSAVTTIISVLVGMVLIAGVSAAIVGVPALSLVTLVSSVVGGSIGGLMGYGISQAFFKPPYPPKLIQQADQVAIEAERHVRVAAL